MTLSSNFINASPRLTPRPMRLPGILMHTGVICLVPVMLTCAALLDSATAWAVGFAYIAYDICSMAFIVRQVGAMPPDHPLQDATSERASLAVIVAAHNEAGALPATLAALACQTDLPDLVVIADDGSSDETGQMLSANYGLIEPALGALSSPGAKSPSLHWLRLSHGGKSSALNEAIASVDAKIVLTIDGDTRLEPTAVAAMRQAFTTDPKLVATGGVIIPSRHGDRLGRLLGWFQGYDYIRTILTRFAWMKAGALLLVPGAFAAYRRDALLAVGGFDPHALVEDYEMTHRMHRYAFDHGLEWTIRITGAAHAHTDVPQRPKVFLRQRRRWFGGFLQTQFWNRDMTGNSRYGKLGRSLLPVKLLDTIQPILGIVAALLFIVFAIAGRWDIAGPALATMALKVAIDLVFYRWAIRTYGHLTGDMTHAASLQHGVNLAPLIAPFSFQLLRHTGECWGWLAFISGQLTWETPARPLAESAETKQADSALV